MSQLALEVDSVYEDSALDYCRLDMKVAVIVRPLKMRLNTNRMIRTWEYLGYTPEKLAKIILEQLRGSRLERLIRNIKNIEQVNLGGYYRFMINENYGRELKKILGLD